MAWSEWKKQLQELKREKNHKKKEETRLRPEQGSKYGFNDMPVVRTCQECGEEKQDVYKFRIEDGKQKSRITGYPVRELCLDCCFKCERQRVNLVPINTRDEWPEGRREVLVYDNKPRVKVY